MKSLGKYEATSQVNRENHRLRRLRAAQELSLARLLAHLAHLASLRKGCRRQATIFIDKNTSCCLLGLSRTRVLSQSACSSGNIR